MQLFNNPFSELGSLNELCGIRCIRPVVYMSNWKGRLGCKGFNIGSAAFSITLCRVVVRVRSYLPFPSAVKGIHSEANGIGTGCPVRNSGSSVRVSGTRLSHSQTLLVDSMMGCDEEDHPWPATTLTI